MSLKNSKSKSLNTFANIQKCLVAHKVQRIMFEYNQHGQSIALSFSIDMDGTLLNFRLPARVENVSRIMYGALLAELGGGKIADEKREQVYRTAWANIRDWITAQMAMIDTGMVSIEEVFLPYVIVDKDNSTLFEKMKSKGGFLLTGNDR